MPRVGVAGDNVKQESVTAVPRRPSESRQEPINRAASGVACSHSDDFRSVNWFGKTFSFSDSQARCIEILWKHWERGKLSVHQLTIANAIGSSNDNYRLRDTFRLNGGMHPAWKSMIQRHGKGAYRLVDPSNRRESPKNP